FVVMFLADKFEQDPHLKQLLITGFLGAFTTFSTYMLEIVQLITGHTTHHGWLYLAVSIVLGLAAVVLGTYVGNQAGQPASVFS
ncbi:MAG: CrcB family protein, partial [Anaerolineae bacterium]|nr:CrcB family protein [Anaerolineae bacterium]